MVAAGCVAMVIGIVTTTAAHPPDAAMVYETVYGPAVLVLGVMAPVAALILNPAGVAVKVPPVVPVIVAGCGVVNDVQNTLLV